MKRINFFLSLAVVLLLLLAACSPAQPQPTEAVTSPAETAPAAEVTEAAATESEPAVTEETETGATEAPTEAETAEMTEAAGGEATPAGETETPQTGTGGTGGAESTASQSQLANLMDYSVRFPISSVRGSIEDFVLDLNAEQIVYALVSINAAAAGGERVVPIPWKALTLNQDSNTFSLGFNLVVAPDAPTVDPEAGPDFTNPEWDQDIRAFWANQPTSGTGGEAGTATPSAGESEATATPQAGGAEATGTPEAGAAMTSTATTEAGGAAGSATATPGSTGAEATGTPSGMVGTEEPGAASQGARYILASDVFDASIHFSGAPAAGAEGEGTPTASAVTLGQALGRVEDLSVNPTPGQILFASVRPNEFLGLAEGVWVPIPVRLLSTGPRSGTLVLSLNAEALDLQNLPTFDPNQLPDFNQAEWLDQFRAFWESINP